jgi:shikimate dehydrogenase
MDVTPGRATDAVLSAETTVVGVIGDPVGHSLSPVLHNSAFAAMGIDWVSVGFPVPTGRAGDALVGAAALGVRGLSVTMPHKAPAAAVVDVRSPLVELLGVVNCVVRRDGLWLGENTDGPGFVASLRHHGRFDPEGARCLVVGAGGAARAVVAGLAGAGAAEVVVVNRSPERAAVAAALAGPVGRVGEGGDATACALVVNATPLGMGNPGAHGTAWPVEPAHLHSGQVVVDLVYHPRITPWMDAAQRRGAEVANGLGMLVHQAALQLEIWTGLDVPVDVMWRAATGSGSGGTAAGPAVI